jgi:hypothetical protein
VPHLSWLSTATTAIDGNPAMIVGVFKICVDLEVNGEEMHSKVILSGRREVFLVAVNRNWEIGSAIEE